MMLVSSEYRYLSLAIAVLGLALHGCAQEAEPEAPAAASEMAAPMPAEEPAADTIALEDSRAYPAEGIPTFSTGNLARKGFYYAGGEYVGDPPIMGGQMYVEVWEPREVTQPYPLVIFHGNGQTGVDWLQTPDGRAGWAYYLIEQGYVLYMVDYPARGRSTYIPGGVHGDLGIRTAEQLESLKGFQVETVLKVTGEVVKKHVGV